MLSRRQTLAGMLGFALSCLPFGRALASRHSHENPEETCTRFIYGYRKERRCYGSGSRRRCRTIRRPLYAVACLIPPVCEDNGVAVDCETWEPI